MLLVAHLICSDVDCAERAEESVASLAELDALACECGCTWELLAVSLDADAPSAPAVALEPRRPAAPAAGLARAA